MQVMAGSGLNLRYFARSISTGLLSEIHVLPTRGIQAGVIIEAAPLKRVATHAYVSNAVDGTISQYSVDAAGVLTPQGSVPAGGSPGRGAVDLAGNYLYVPDAAAGTVRRFAINPSTGQLVALGATAAGAGATQVIIAPDQRHVYCLNRAANTISVFLADASGGLTLQSTAATGSDPVSISIDPTGYHFICANAGSSTLTDYWVNNYTGELNSYASPALGGEPLRLAADPRGYGFVAMLATTDQVQDISYAGGGAPIGGALTTTGDEPRASAFDHRAGRLFVACRSGNSIATHAYGLGGVQSGPAAVAAPGGPEDVAVAPNDVRLYSVHGSTATIRCYTIPSSGPPVFSESVTAGAGAHAIMLRIVP
jgi:6-phosphogluconolactonase (cycloisomerase 2 family)